MVALKYCCFSFNGALFTFYGYEITHETAIMVYRIDVTNLEKLDGLGMQRFIALHSSSVSTGIYG